MRSLLKAIRFLYGVSAPREQAATATGLPTGNAAWLHWIVPLGLAAGVLLAVIVGLSWGRLTYQPGGELWMAVVPAMLIYWLGPGAARYMGWGRTWASVRLGARMNDLTHDAYPGVQCLGLMVLAIVAAAVTQFVAIAALPTRNPTAPPGMSRDWLPFYYLLFPIQNYGAMVLMGLWGNAAVLLAACLGRPAGHADAMVRQLLAARTWKKMAWAIPGPAAVSMLFLVGWERKWGEPWATAIVPSAFQALAIAVILFGVTMLFAWLLARRLQGHCRATLLAAGLIGEITFLLLFHTLPRQG